MRAAPRSYPRSYLPYAQFELPERGASGLAAPTLAAAALAQEPSERLIGPPAPGLAPAQDRATASRIEASPYGPMFALARRLAAGARSNYDVATRIERYLLSNYAYDEHVPAARYPLESFLFEEHRGYCQQFSGAMTLMLRMDGIPARVGAGFRPALYDPSSGSWRVRALDAHSWVEVLFPGIGWVTFDPTPAQRLPGIAAGEELVGKSVLVGGGLAGGSTQVATHARRAGARRHGRGNGSPMPLAPIAAGLAALAIAWLGARWLAGHRRLRRALEGEAHGATAELDRALAELGGGGRGATLAQLERRLAHGRRRAASDYVGSLRELRYEAAPSRRPDAAGRAALRRALAAGGGPRGWARALAALPPGMVRREPRREA
jgi:transglutaminase-like putative cysteine protease